MHFYFDILDGGTLARDDFGIECLNADAARVEATTALTEMAGDYLPTNGARWNMAIVVRTEAETVFSVSLDFEFNRGIGPS